MVFETTTDILLKIFTGLFVQFNGNRNGFKRVAFETDFFLTHREIFSEFRLKTNQNQTVFTNIRLICKLVITIQICLRFSRFKKISLCLRVDNIGAARLHFLCVTFFIENEDKFEGDYGKLNLRVLKKENVKTFIF